MYQHNYYPFLEVPNYYPYFYPIPSSLPYFPVPTCMSIPEQPISGNLNPYDTSFGQEIQPQEAQEVTIVVKKENKPLDSDSNSEDKISKSSVTAPPQKSENVPLSHFHKGDIKLEFRIEWKNENRNIVPNLINQMVSYLMKKIKSEKLVKKIFDRVPHEPNWTVKKFYLYMKKIKESITHYVNENVILKFLEIHEPKCELYDYEEQQFYMKVSRIAIMKFLDDDAVLISLTSNRMSEVKRKIHLIARDALFRKFRELCHQVKHWYFSSSYITKSFFI